MTWIWLGVGALAAIEGIVVGLWLYDCLRLQQIADEWTRLQREWDTAEPESVLDD